MNKKYAIAILSSVEKQYQKILRKPVNYEYFNKNLLVEGVKSAAVVDDDGSLHCRIAVSEDFLNVNVTDVKEYDFVETMISLHHENYHLLQYMQRPTKEVSKIALKCEQESYLSRVCNNGVYRDFYNSFAYEVAAERYALHATYDYCTTNIIELSTELIMTDYLNARSHVGPNASVYFIPSEIDVKDVNTAFKLFDDAYEKALETKKPFSKYKDDCVGKALSENPALAMGFKRAKDGKEQTHFAATIVLDEHPELYRELRGLNKSDYDIQIVKDARLRPIVVKQRELPNIDYDDTEHTGLDGPQL